MESFKYLWKDLIKDDFKPHSRTEEIGYGHYRKQVTFIPDRELKKLGYHNYLEEINKEFQLKEPAISQKTIKYLIESKKYLIFDYFRKAVPIQETVQNIFL